MDTTPDRYLNQLVVAALTIFILTAILLAALVVRQMWLQQHVAVLSDDVQVRLEALEETTEELQDELLEIQAMPAPAQDPADWEEVTGALDDVDTQLGAIGESIDEVSLMLEPEPEATIATGDDELSAPIHDQPIHDQVDQVFTIFSTIAAIAGIAVAILLGMAIRVQQRTSAQSQHGVDKSRSHTVHIGGTNE